ncbi:hypothetical protein TKWG_03600 [Advenella kashmirensis WT001]|uniref:Uncharacterized protein n=1 Tax=Advenella kashmirensis (strain DSM 17095 / LMG 22695 / WT001) TaxID=1036672 RepID=I3U8G7_ADVKW|nr:hypothetical protein TKWG_03600 [Advenella kashmirensis WT001]
MDKFQASVKMHIAAGCNRKRRPASGAAAASGHRPTPVAVTDEAAGEIGGHRRGAVFVMQAFYNRRCSYPVCLLLLLSTS